MTMNRTASTVSSRVSVRLVQTCPSCLSGLVLIRLSHWSDGSATVHHQPYPCAEHCNLAMAVQTPLDSCGCWLHATRLGIRVPGYTHNKGHSPLLRIRFAQGHRRPAAHGDLTDSFVPSLRERPLVNRRSEQPHGGVRTP
jgi:hypothetical protein